MNERLEVKHLEGLKWMLKHDYVHQMDRVWVAGVIKELEAEPVAAAHSEDGREVPEVVAYVDEHGTTVSVGRQGAWISGHDRAIPDCWDRLMTVAQHERIVDTEVGKLLLQCRDWRVKFMNLEAAKDAEIAEWREQRNDLIEGNNLLHAEIAELRAQPARQLCEFHGDDSEACEKYSGRVPCEPARQVGGGALNADGLMPCPFCGNREVKPDDSYIMCQCCGAMIDVADANGRDFVSAWNRRAALAPAAVVIPELEDAAWSVIARYPHKPARSALFFTEAEADAQGFKWCFDDGVVSITPLVTMTKVKQAFARLNRRAIPAAELEQIAVKIDSLEDASGFACGIGDELRALLGKEGE